MTNNKERYKKVIGKTRAGSTIIDENIKSMFEQMQTAQKMGMDKKTRWLEQVSSIVFLLSPPILAFIIFRQFFISDYELMIRIVYLLIGFIIIIGYGWYIFRESLLWKVFRS